MLMTYAMSLVLEMCFSAFVFSCRDTPKNNDQVRETVSSRRKNRDRKHIQIPEHDYSFDVPVRSAPTSPFSSPKFSPHRSSAGDLVGRRTPSGNQVWSAPEMPTYDVFSNESSPINSPTGRSPCRNIRSPPGSSPLHPRLSVTSEVHPLPLPPGASLPSPSLPSAQPVLAPKPESQPIKGQWQKGKLIGRGTFGSVYVATNRSVQFLVEVAVALFACGNC